MKAKNSTLILRLPNELKHKVELLAEGQGVSLNQFAMYAFTKEVIQLEASSFYESFWKGQSKKQIFEGFEAVMKKVKKRPVPEWDRLP